MSRTTGVDIITGEGLAEALTRGGGHCRRRVVALLRAVGGRNLHEAVRTAQVGQITMASIIGVDKAIAGFVAAKKVHEELPLSGPPPFASCGPHSSTSSSVNS